jgi:hypothetical protein
MNLNLTLIFRVINIVVGCFMIIGGVMTCIAGGKLKKSAFKV